MKKLFLILALMTVGLVNLDIKGNDCHLDPKKECQYGDDCSNCRYLTPCCSGWECKHGDDTRDLGHCVQL